MLYILFTACFERLKLEGCASVDVQHAAKFIFGEMRSILFD